MGLLRGSWIDGVLFDYLQRQVRDFVTVSLFIFVFVCLFVCLFIYVFVCVCGFVCVLKCTSLQSKREATASKTTSY